MDWAPLMRLAYGVAMKSRDRSMQVGAILVNKSMCVLSVGFNRFPNSVTETPERWECPAKYTWIEHAERDVLYSSQSTQGTTMICTCAACKPCALAIMSHGLQAV